MVIAQCSVQGCDKGGRIKLGFCSMHYERFRRYGDPNGGKWHIKDFWDRMTKMPSGCWEWDGSRTWQGYGTCGRGPGKQFSTFAHRRAYQMAVGPIPEGLVLDHLCRNPPCCNPEHLEPVTILENVLRGVNGTPRTECPQGHQFNDENTYWYGERKHCKPCHSVASRKSKSKKRAEKLANGANGGSPSSVVPDAAPN